MGWESWKIAEARLGGISKPRIAAMGSRLGEMASSLKWSIEMNRLIWLFVLTLVSCAVTYEAPVASQQTEAQKMKSTYLVIYRPGPAWIPGKPVAAQPLKEHGRYMLSLYKNGTLKFAGPFTDNAGGAVVFEAENEDEAKAVVAADPAVTSKIFLSELHPWGLVDWERYVKNGAVAGGARTPPIAAVEHRTTAQQSQSITVTGKLTDEGVECKAMRGDDGKLYTLTGDLKDFRTGDRIKVTGRIAEMSNCMQGTTLSVEKIERAK
jgi:uncharacterized protein